MGAVVDGMPPLLLLGTGVRLEIPRTKIWHPLVKFDSDTLPPIFNALNTENNGQKLVLEVAVSLMAGLD